MKTKLINSLVILLLLSCGQNKSFAEELSKENLVAVQSDELNIRLMVPKENRVFETLGKLTIDVHPTKRMMRQFTIMKSESTMQHHKYTESMVFENGSFLNYFTYVEEGGNAGAEFQLEGMLKIGNQTFKIHATDQREWHKGTPEFCFKYLSTIIQL